MEEPAPAADLQVPHTPDSAPAADLRVPQTPDSSGNQYPEEWSPMEEVEEYLGVTRRADGPAVHEVEPLPRRDRNPLAPPSPGAPPWPGADVADAQPLPRRDRNPLAPPSPGAPPQPGADGADARSRGASARSSRRKVHFARNDPRHSGPRLLTFEGGDICRQWNRGCCAPVQEGPSSHFGVCKHWRHHACSQCGSLEHPAFRCTTPEAEWPPKE